MKTVRIVNEGNSGRVEITIPHPAINSRKPANFIPISPSETVVTLELKHVQRVARSAAELSPTMKKPNALVGARPIVFFYSP
jgi:hypothetical protein